MKVGFTGWRAEIPKGRRISLHRVILDLHEDCKISEFHHGDCIGMDVYVHRFCISIGIWTVKHPPINSIARAFCETQETRETFPYLQRNRNIVDESDIMIACPKDPNQEILRSGTWATIRYARKQGKKVIIV